MSKAHLEALARDIEHLIGIEQTDLALDLIDEALTDYPDEPKLLYLKGCLHHQRDELPDAIEALKTCADLSPDYRARAMYMLGNAHRDADDIASACDCYNRALELAPGMTDAWVNMGSALDDAGQHELALRCYDAALAIDANDAVAWHNRGNSLRELEHYREAAVSYAQSARLSTDSLESQLALAACRVQLQEQGALEDLRQIFDTSHSPLALFELATALSYSQQFAEALSCFEQLIEQGIDEPALWNNRGECLARLGKIDQALQSLDRAIQADPYFEAAYIGKSRILANHGRFSEAKTVIQELLDFCSDEVRNSDAVRQLLAT